MYNKSKSLITSEATLSLKSCGELLAEARKNRGLSVLALSKRAGVDRRTISQLESGHPGVSIGTFFQVLSLLNLRGIEECLKPENDLESIALHIRKLRKGQKVSNKIADSEVNF